MKLSVESFKFRSNVEFPRFEKLVLNAKFRAKNSNIEYIKEMLKDSIMSKHLRLSEILNTVRIQVRIRSQNLQELNHIHSNTYQSELQTLRS